MDIYGEDVKNMNEIYENLGGNGSGGIITPTPTPTSPPVTYPDTVPIKTAVHLDKIGSGEVIEIDGVAYSFEKGKEYVLQNDISYSGNYEKIGNMIKNSEIRWSRTKSSNSC